MNTFQNELYHEGVKGMKWGVRHGPPYPLARGGRALSSLFVKSRDPEKMAAKAEAKAERKKARAEKRAERKVERAIRRAENKERRQAEKETRAAERAEKRAREEQEAENRRLEKRKREIRKGKIDIKDLNDDELKYASDRLKMEDDVLTRLGRDTPAQILRDKKERQIHLVNTVLKDVGKNAIAPLATGLVTDFVYRKLTKEPKKAKQPNPYDTLDKLTVELFKPSGSKEDNQAYTDVLKVLSNNKLFGQNMNTAASQYQLKLNLRNTIKDDDLYTSISKNLFGTGDVDSWIDSSTDDYERILERGRRITARMNKNKQ